MDSLDRSMAAARFVFPLGDTPYHVVMGLPWEEPDEQEMTQFREIAMKQFRKMIADAESNVTVEVGTLGDFIGEEAPSGA